MDPLVAGQIVVAAAQDLLFACAAGTLACSALCARGEPSGGASSHAAVVERAHASAGSPGRVRAIALIGLMLACCLYLWLQAAVMSGSTFSAAAPAISVVLTQSHFGAAWSVGCAGAVLGCLGGTRDSRAAWWLAALGMLVYAAGKAAASHAADTGDFTVREAVHVVHLTATALWAGSVIVAAPLLWRWRRAAAMPPMQCEAFCTRLSHLATLALVVVIGSGIYNAAQDTAHLSGPLLDAWYGRVLTVKLVFVALAVLLGGYNRMIHLPRLHATAIEGGDAYRDAQRRFDRLLSVEAIAMIAVLIAAAVLGHTAPTGG
ncbi:copper resistance D family protein [Paraburkholderia sp. DHOC27]|uniref:copper resistance D family protein n=1 Tax=Paraburkholderia sp. DHOC27 TaxID=2303330 RepID=UPI0015F2FC5F|nr:CopD family protein [Paraburkholderia sp. DHOC27]